MEIPSPLDDALDAHERQDRTNRRAVSDHAELLERFDGLARDFVQRFDDAGHQPHTILHLGSPTKSVDRVFGGTKTVPSGVPRIPIIIIAASVGEMDSAWAQPRPAGTVMTLERQYYFAEEGHASFAAVLGEANGWHLTQSGYGAAPTPGTASEELFRLLALRFAELLRNGGRPVIRPLFQTNVS